MHQYIKHRFSTYTVMILDRLNIKFKHVCAAHLLTALTILLAGCDSLVYDDSDCVTSCNEIRLVYDHNMKFADAFDSEVEHVSLLIFDTATGLLAQRYDVDESELSENNGIEVVIDPGQYELLVWAGRHTDSFEIARGTDGQSRIEDFHCKMNRQDGGHINDDLARLYHGTLTIDADYSKPSDPNIHTVYLKKDTNVIRVVLQHLSGERIDCDDFDFKITDNNGWMNHDNTLRDDELLQYHPWYLYSGYVDINTNPNESTETRSGYAAALAEFTTGRLIWGNNPTLTITDKKEGKTVMSININDYAMLVKGFYHQQMSEQEYLDRQDEYNMTFFLDEHNRWINTVIIINDWRIIRYEGPVE